MEENNAFVSLKHLQKIYDNGAKAVYDFNLDINKNEFIVIVGPSGCGKTTTLRMIAGLEAISSGELYIDNQLSNYKPCKDRKIAIVFQNYALYPQMTVFENIAFPLRTNKYPHHIIDEVLLANNEILNIYKDKGSEFLQGIISEAKNTKLTSMDSVSFIVKRLNVNYVTAEKMLKINFDDKNVFESLKLEISNEELFNLNNNKKVNENFEFVDSEGLPIVEKRKMTSREVEEKVFEAAKILDLGPYLDRLPKQLSGGQMQRVALGRAIVKNVPLFLMDEPLSNLDAKLRQTMRGEIVKLHNKINTTTIYVTHDQTEAMTMASRIVVMSKGFVQQIGKPKDIYNYPDNIFVAKFIGSPSINIFDSNYIGDKLVISDKFSYKISDEFKKVHDKFYQDKLEFFNQLIDNYDQRAEESVLKIMSSLTDVNNTSKIEVKKSKSIFKTKIAEIFGKKKEIINEEVSTYNIALEKRDLIKEALNGNHKIITTIRPEKISIKKYNGEKLDNNEIIIEPSVCELLGSDYHIHFDLFNQEVIAKIIALDEVKLGDKLVVRFEKSFLQFFDPITGSRIDASL